MINYAISVVVVAIIMTLLAVSKKSPEFPIDDKRQLLRLLVIILCPGLNVIYGLAIFPFFFSEDPYRWTR